MLLEGVFCALPTPFYPDERLYARKLEANVARYSRGMLSGMLLLGSTGEAPALTEEESIDVLRIAADAAAPEKVLIAGVGRESVRATLELAEAAARFRYDAILVKTPTYYARQMSRAAVLHYFRSVADRSPLPVVLYNIPSCVPYSIPVEVIVELADHPNIIGIKDSSGDTERIDAICSRTALSTKRIVNVTSVFRPVTERMLLARTIEDATFVAANDLAMGTALAAPMPVLPSKDRTKEVGFQVLSGSSSRMLDALKAGASGAVLGFAACAPLACAEIYLAYKDRDIALAEAKQARIAQAAQRIVGDLGVAGVKAACDFNGYYGGRARAPLLPVSAVERAEIEGLLASIRA